VNGTQEFLGQGTKKLTFWHAMATIFMLARILDSIGLNPSPVRGSGFVAKILKPRPRSEWEKAYVVLQGWG